MNSRTLIVVCFVVVVAGVGVCGIPFGIGQHDDARLILDHSVPAILAGSYLPSRAFGVPLFEYAAAFFDVLGGVRAVQYYCLALTLLSVIGFDRLLGPDLDGWRRSLALAGFAFHPLILINATTVFEWSQMVLLSLCLLLTATRWLKDAAPTALVLYAVFSLLLVLTRPDMLFFCLSLFLALTWQTGFRRAALLPLIGANAVAAALALLAFAGLNHGLRDLFDQAGAILLYTPVAQRIAIAALRLPILFGLIGMLDVAALFLRAIWRARDPRDISFWERLLLIAAPIFVIRFMTLPDKLEYALPLLVVVLLAAAHARPNAFLLPIVSLPIVAMSLVTVSLFERRDDKLHLAFHVDPGAVIQDWEVSRYDMMAHDPAFLDAVAKQVYRDETGSRPGLHAENFAEGLVSDAGDLVVGDAELYRLDNPGFPVEKFHRSAYRRIYICDRSLYSPAGGWRSLQPPPSLPAFDRQTGQTDLACARETPASGDKP